MPPTPASAHPGALPTLLDWLERHANGVSIPHCPTATTRRSLWAAAR